VGNRVVEGVISSTKYLLTLAGARLPEHWIYQAQAAANYLTIGRWMRDHDFQPTSRLRDRWEVFDTVAACVRDQRVLYLEFGVFEGASIRYWASKLHHPDTRLHGFDSFEGLPETWGPHVSGHFTTGGRIPVVDDPRVAFFKGWFDEVLPTYQPPPHDVLVIVLDADLYSSTRLVLTQMRPHIRPGTFIYFDELNHVEHEPKAFDEFMSETSLHFRLVCADRTLAFAFFECIAD
jgi:Macrocin-O-methyltransferase (TylF)